MSDKIDHKNEKRMMIREIKNLDQKREETTSLIDIFSTTHSFLFKIKNVLSHVLCKK